MICRIFYWHGCPYTTKIKLFCDLISTKDELAAAFRHHVFLHQAFSCCLQNYFYFAQICHRRNTSWHKYSPSQKYSLLYFFMQEILIGQKISICNYSIFIINYNMTYCLKNKIVKSLQRYCFSMLFLL